MITRRKFIGNSLALGVFASLRWLEVGAQQIPAVFMLRAGKSSQQIVPDQYDKTDVWCFNHSIPGPELRIRQGDRCKILVNNNLDEETTVHWHGLRIPHNMDGVPHLTQHPIQPGESFLYEFEAKDAGTFWYHPHQRSFEQVGRGLYGALVVEEKEPVLVDRELVWLLDDWSMEKTAQISESFGDMHDVSHAGRMGNTVTVNGRIPERLPVQSGERIRLRLINAANARIFGLEFEGHKPSVISMDGQPVSPHHPTSNQIVLAPGMRIDLILDCINLPGQTFNIVDRFYDRQPYRLMDVVYMDDILRKESLDSPIKLPANPLVEPDLSTDVRFKVDLAGGARGTMEGAMLNGQWRDIRSLVHNGKAWAINGVAASGHVMDPLFTLKMGQSCVLSLNNDTSWHHPMHLHGHSFRVLSRNGKAVQYAPWQDTVLMDPGERIDIAFVADNPGDWMFHCHILEHQAGGMMAVVRVE